MNRMVLPPQNILIIHTHGGMGDLLLSSVLSEALHRCYPGCRVTLWSQPRFAPLFDHHPFVDACLDLDSAASLLTNARALRAKNFDTAFVPWSVSRHAWLTALACIPTRVGQGGRFTYSFLFTHPVRVRSVYGDTTSHWADIQLDYVRAIGCQPTSDLQPIVVTTQTEKEKAATFLKSVGLLGDRPICGLHICKGLAVDEERWPIDRFVDIAAELMRKGYNVALTGTAGEKALTTKVAAQAQARLQTEATIVDLAGTCSLRETAAVIEHMNVFICPDTGTGHLAAALGVPVVSIFPLRSDIPARWRPAGHTYRIIRPTSYECDGTCVKETCPRFTCLLHIDPVEVVAAAQELTK
ncbi:MAG: ADP-heptose--LPS heptosyltransferase [Firmicutes bacterium]|nr:ADP-heptose--LPS heptosyltransferase [Bacillota bacterium]